MKLRMKLTEGDAFHSVTGIIAHNPIMKSVWWMRGVAEDKIVVLAFRLFDSKFPRKKRPNKKTNYVAGLAKKNRLPLSIAC